MCIYIYRERERERERDIYIWCSHRFPDNDVSDWLNELERLRVDASKRFLTKMLELEHGVGSVSLARAKVRLL